MAEAIYVLFINFTVLVTAGFGYAAASWVGGDRRPERIVALGLGLLIAANVLAFVAPALGTTVQFRLLMFGFILGGLLTLGYGVAAHYDKAPPVSRLIASFLISLMAVYFTLDLPRDLALRHAVMSTAEGGAVLLVVVAVLRLARRDMLDWLLSGAAALLSAQFLVQPFLITPLGGMGSDASEYLGTEFALVTLTLQTIATVLTIGAMSLVFLRSWMSRLAGQSLRDPLTGLLNRRGLDERAEQQRREMARRFRPMAVVIADIDHFKRVNDTYGHAAGDVVIKTFGRILSGTARATDCVARIGGEEFVVLLADASPIVGRLYAEGVRTAFSELELDAAGGDRQTASFGVAELTAERSLAEAIHLADVALYRAKREGRNRTILHVDEEPPDQLTAPFAARARGIQGALVPFASQRG